jgi:flavorubredoxin
MTMRRVTDGLWWLGAVDWDRRLFDSLIPLPDGTSYNAYLLKGDKRTVLFDTVDPMMTDVLLSQLAEVPSIDYVVSHHAEQDHSGAIPHVLARYSSAQVLATPKAKGMLVDLLQVPEHRITTVADGETLDLGGRTLQFVHTPWVHWPETMVSYLREDRILFSCDFFGSHIATSDLYVTEEWRVYEAAKRYYAEIMMPFRRLIAGHLDKIGGLAFDLIAPSHGPIYDRPRFILDAYRDWVSDEPRNSVVLPYVSMHGSTRRMVEHLVEALVQRDIAVHQFDLAVTDIGKLAIALVDAATLVVGTPTVHAGPHPLVVYAAHLANALRPKLAFASIIGSYGWATKAVEQIASMIPNLKVEVLSPVMCKGLPGDADFRALDNLADAIAAKHAERHLV